MSATWELGDGSLHHEDQVDLFALDRQEDVSGISGTGVVAVGMVLPSGRVVLEWLGVHNGISVFKSLHDLLAVHGHDGKTVIRWAMR